MPTLCRPEAMLSSSLSSSALDNMDRWLVTRLSVGTASMPTGTALDGTAIRAHQHAAGPLKALGGGAGAAVGQHVRDAEREGRERLLEERPRARPGPLIPDR